MAYAGGPRALSTSLTVRERIGRFGWKAQHATLLAFSGDAYRNEMGITNDLFPDEVALGIDAERLKLCSPKRGIEDVRNRRTGMRGIDNFESFMKFLAPIERGPIDAEVRCGRGGLPDDGLRGVPRSGVDDRGESQSAVRPEAGAALLGPAAARRRNRRWNRAVCRGSRRDPDTGTLGAALPAPAAARRERRDSGRRDPAARPGSCRGDGEIPEVAGRLAAATSGVPQFALRQLRYS